MELSVCFSATGQLLRRCVATGHDSCQILGMLVSVGTGQCFCWNVLLLLSWFDGNKFGVKIVCVIHNLDSENNMGELN